MSRHDEIPSMSRLTMLTFFLASLAPLSGCFATALGEQQQLAHQQRGKDRKQVARSCQNSMDQLYEAYCDGAIETVPVGLSEQLTQQRNGLAMNCKNTGSEANLAQLDTCITELASNE